MIDISLIKEQYSLMSDEHLIAFAQNESDKLTIESFHVLKEEFEKRGLDLSVIEGAQLDRDLNNMNKQTKFEEVATNQFIEAIWQKAFEDKKNGKSNLEIYNALIKKGIEEKYAYILIESLETKSLELIKHYEAEIKIEWFVLALVLFFIYLSFQNILPSMYIIYGVIIISGAGFKLIKSYSRKNRYQEVYNNIQIENESYAAANISITSVEN